MLFNSLAFAVFLPIVFILYWLIPHKYRWILVLAASYYFYMSWNAKYVFLILFTTVISYLSALALEKSESKCGKKWILAGTAAACLGVLFFFKYFNFVSTSVAAVFKMFAIELNPILLNLLLPVGISFYTFQTLSYVIDVYRGDAEAEHHFGYYASFISFFPQLVAGPIERTGNLLPQIKAEHKFSCAQATYGLKLIAWGLFKKVSIADIVSPYVQTVFDNPHNFSGFSLILTAVFFAIQIYCDFSGYSDIAIGTAKLLGINLTTNFRSPYFSQSIKEFWSRWHISLSTWFRDYVYIPLGGSRVGKIRHAVNLLVTFLISGLWHGANWTFVVWGGIHGFGQVVENLLITKETLKTESKGIVWVLRVLFVFAFTSFAWIFFVSDSLADSMYVVRHMFCGITSPITFLHDGFLQIIMTKKAFTSLAMRIFVLALYDYVSLKTDVIEKISSCHVIVRWGIYVITACTLVFILGNAAALSSRTEFIYFQF